MRERLVMALVGTTIVVVALYAVPRAYFLADLVQGQEVHKIERSADLLALLLTERSKARRPVTERFLEQTLNEAEYVEYIAPDGTSVTAGEPPPGEDSDIAATRPVRGTGSVTVSRSGELVDERVSEALTPLVLIGIALAVLAALVGSLLARRLSRPFSELADRADRLGQGRFDVDVPHYRVREAEHIGAALRTSAAQLQELVRREREFAVNASHQLRTPITALRLELEDVTLWPQTPPDVADQLRQALSELDRLSDAITELLDLARGQRLGAAADVDLSALVADAVARWRDRLAGYGRELAQGGTDPVPARVAQGPVAQVLDVLIENAAVHGAGRVVVDAEEVGTHLQIRVTDEGSSSFGTEVFGRGVSRMSSPGTGVGLAVAAELAEAIGGYLSLDDHERTRFTLRLPRGT